MLYCFYFCLHTLRTIYFIQLFSLKVIEEADELQRPVPISMWEALQLNSKEWPQILIGSISSLIMGSAMPIFAVLFGNIIAVSAISLIFIW